MPFKISRIGHLRGRPVAQGFGKCGEITRHSASVKSVWYRLTGRLCCRRVAGVHMANPSWFKNPLESRRAPMRQSFQKLHWQGPKGLSLDIDGWLRRIGLEQYTQTF